MNYLAHAWLARHSDDAILGGLLGDFVFGQSALQAVVPRMATHDWLGSYARREAVDHAVRGIATRLSRNGDKLVDCLGVLRAEEGAVGAAFAGFFPDLIENAARVRVGKGSDPHPHDEEPWSKRMLTTGARGEDAIRLKPVEQDQRQRK